MSIKSKVLATAATLTMVGGIATAGVLGTSVSASAETPSCGISCLDIFSQEFGTHHDPGFVLDVYQQHIRIGQPVILFRESNADLAEDFRPELQGTVADFLAAQMVTPAFALHYGCIPAGSGGAGSGNFPDCFGLGNSATQADCITGTAGTGGNCNAFNDPAFEIEYAPNGQLSGLCVGVAKTAVQEEGVTLQECGASSKTVWAIDLYDQPFDSFGKGYAPLINGSDTNFSQPYVLTYPQSGYPTDKPRPQLQVDNLTGYTQGFPPATIALNYPTVPDYQLWGADLGGTHLGI
jgi:hypothetical protein